ncbi:MAG TPA: AhpC/TSA family protein, partial [Stellaceae bacterium]|nr:AhpC/TSA family protein [Stellaceae bacterium]
NVYRGFGIDLPRHDGEGSWTLAMPGRIVVDRGGVIRAVDVDPDYTRRPEPEQTLAAVASLK